MLEDKLAEVRESVAENPMLTAGMTMHDWLETTVELQCEAFKRNPPTMSGEELADWCMMNLNAMHDEVSELSAELGWKPWSQPRGWVNREAAIGEAVDLMHFLANILTAMRVTGAELTEAYLRKVEKNAARQAGGDDVRARRCPGCGRSIDDAGTVQLFIEGEYRTCCTMCGHRIEEVTVAG